MRETQEKTMLKTTEKFIAWQDQHGTMTDNEICRGVDKYAILLQELKKRVKNTSNCSKKTRRPTLPSFQRSFLSVVRAVTKTSRAIPSAVMAI